MGRKGPTLAELEQEAAVRLTQGSEASEGQDASAREWVGEVLRVAAEMTADTARATYPNTDVLYWLWRAEMQRDLAGYVAAALLLRLGDLDRDFVSARILGEIRDNAERATPKWREVARNVVIMAWDSEHEGSVGRGIRAVAELYLWDLAGRG